MLVKLSVCDSSMSLQVLQLLELMDLTQYKENFEREHISGEVLIECDEDVLMQELGILSKLHRIRLLKIISGQQSAKDIFDGN